MAQLTLDSVSIDFPIFGAHAVSLKQTLASAATGGRIGRETGVAVIQALRDISLDLKEGDRLGVIGHNGAGKSTLLRTLAGVYPPTRGRYARTGTISSLIDPMLGIEMDATGYENITIRGLILGIGHREMARLIPEIAEFSGLGDYLDMPVRTYSTGMLMRLGFSIATSIRSDILLMDEWMSVGDAEFKQKAEERLREIVSNTGILVLASHSPELIERECNRVIELSHGGLVRAEWLNQTPGGRERDPMATASHG
jgi:lipopolysaccharide transport system ATP-binding protein